MDHQTETNNLNISISYRYIPNIQKPDYPDFRGLAKDVETFLSNYPNKDDYWEIVNKRITSLLLSKYRGLTSVTCEIKVDRRLSFLTHAQPVSLAIVNTRKRTLAAASRSSNISASPGCVGKIR
jgi:hypothetical protein